MKVLFFDCFSGISGDMILGALLDLGVDKDKFLKELNKLNIGGYRISIEKKEQFGIYATDFNVILTDSEEHTQDDKYHICRCNVNAHHHNNTGMANENHENHTQPIINHKHHGRNLFDIEEIIDKSDISDKAKKLSKKIFNTIAEAEAKVHNKDVSKIHFHEVGAVDSIVDIVGVSICMDLLGIDIIYSSPLTEGTGFVKCEHGELPIPVPAVMEMLKNAKIPIVIENINTELVTPTGLAILKTIATRFCLMPKMYVEGVGYGLGKRSFGRFNALRVVLGNLFEDDIINNEVTILEANIDDMSPQVLGYVFEKLLDNGALDVYHTPIYMKKNRPAYLLSVICNSSEENRITDIIFRETSTIGIRKSKRDRIVMDREIKTINSHMGEIRYKIATWNDITKKSPEYEDAKKIATNYNMPLYQALDFITKMAKEEN
jgi:uncharacterized protein (TIGR00299 family) protein